MAKIRIKDLPVVTAPETTDKILLDDTTEGTRSITIQNFLTSSGARIFVQTTAPATTYPNGSIWIDSDSTDLDLYQLVSAVWTDTTLNLKGTPGTNGTVAVSGTPTVNQITAWVDATTVKGISITGLVKGNGASAPAAAVSGTDYAPATSGSAILKGNGSGGFSSAAAGTDYQAADAQLFSNIPQNSQSTAYAIVATDAQKHIFHPVGDNNARTFTIPANASVAFPLGTAITFINKINTVTIAITSDTLTLAGAGTTGSRTLAANGWATAIKITTTEWMINGTGLT